MYAVQGSVSIPIFTSGRIRSDVHAAEALLVQRRAEYRDLEGRVEYDVRISRLDAQSSESAVKVAQANQKLAQKALEQSEDRYKSGVTNYLEVLEAQEALVAANENYVASLFSYNVAKNCARQGTWVCGDPSDNFLRAAVRLTPPPKHADKEADMATAAKLEEVEKIASPETNKESTPGAKVSKKVLAIALAALGVLGALGYWLNARHYESTDDAQVDGHFAQLSTRITGTVTYVNPLVENDRFVSAGTLLLELDPRDYEAELEHAKATFETKEARLHAAQLQVPITDASAFSQLHLLRQPGRKRLRALLRLKRT